MRCSNRLGNPGGSSLEAVCCWGSAGSNYFTLDFGPFWVAFMVMNWGGKNWKDEWHEMYLRHVLCRAFCVMLSLFIATGGLGNCLVEYIYVGLQVHSVQSPKLYPFAFLNSEFQTSAGSSMIRSAVYISYIRWVTDKNGLDGDAGCFVQSMLIQASCI